MKSLRNYLNLALVFTVLTSLLFSTQGQVLAQPANEQSAPPLFPNLEWTHSENVEKDITANGQTLTLTGETYEAVIELAEKRNVMQFYAPENLESSGWMFAGDNSVDVTFKNNSGQYLSVTNVNCSDLENYCISVWLSNPSQPVQEKSFAPKVDPVGYNKISPANGAIIPMPSTTHHFLTWTDALLQDNYPDDRYQYCIDTTNNNSCDADNWVTRNSLYSGDAEFTLAEGVTYYWQVRTRDTLIYANGAAAAWWSFKISTAIVGFNKITPVNGATINMPTTTYRLLNWGDALLSPGNKYQYCIDTTNNNACDTEWKDRESLYSGGDPGLFDFPLIHGYTYYWQVRSKNEPQIYANDNANAWFSFTIQAILPTPSVSSILRKTPLAASTNAASVEYKVTFSQYVVGVDVTDFELTKTGTITGESVTSVTTLDGVIYTVTVNTGTGSGTLRLDFDDDDTVVNFQGSFVGGTGINNGDYNAGQLYNVRTFPLVVSSIPATTLTPGIIEFTVTFNEDVTGVGTSDFTLFTTGAVSGASITGVTATSSASVYKVTVHTGAAGAGTIRLDVVDDDSILNVPANPLGGVGAGNGNFTGGIAFNKSTFADVPTSGSPWSPYESAIKSVFNAGITAGCGGGYYCPGDSVTRAQMAVFLLRGMHGGAYVPPAATGTVFSDVTLAHPLAAWIEQLSAEGITSGCGSGNYCPNNFVSRGEMAIFLLRADHGSAYIPPAATGTLFADVPLSHPFAAWIEQLANQGVTSGCGGGNYCPYTSILRAQMAVFLKNTFSLP